jgi:hypothetical protein
LFKVARSSEEIGRGHGDIRSLQGTIKGGGKTAERMRYLFIELWVPENHFVIEMA